MTLVRRYSTLPYGNHSVGRTNCCNMYTFVTYNDLPALSPGIRLHNRCKLALTYLATPFSNDIASSASGLPPKPPSMAHIVVSPFRRCQGSDIRRCIGLSRRQAQRVLCGRIQSANLNRTSRCVHAPFHIFKSTCEALRPKRALLN